MQRAARIVEIAREYVGAVRTDHEVRPLGRLLIIVLNRTSGPPRRCHRMTSCAHDAGEAIFHVRAIAKLLMLQAAQYGEFGDVDLGGSWPTWRQSWRDATRSARCGVASVIKSRTGRLENQVAFTVGVIALGAKMAKADGVVTMTRSTPSRRYSRCRRRDEERRPRL